MRRTRSNKKNIKGTRKGGMFKSTRIGNTGISYRPGRGFEPTRFAEHHDKIASSGWLWVAVIFFIILSNMVGQHVKISQALNYAAENGITKAVNVVPLDYRLFSKRVLHHGQSEWVNIKLTNKSLKNAIEYYEKASPELKDEIEEEVENLLKKNGSSSRRSSKSSSRKSGSQN